MRQHTAIITAVAAFLLGGVSSAWTLLPDRALPAGSPLRPVWNEVSWPFPMDQWGRGTAYRCGAADCGREITVYLRAKIGFCNCSKGVADDADLDKVSDFDLFGGALYAQAPGAPVQVAWMKGRSRPFAVGGATMISIGLHEDCDALVATAVLPRGELAASEPLVMDFLASRTMADWAQTTLGL